MKTIILLTVSNVFMTFAWYGHLKHKTAPLLLVIVISWGIAFFEYCFQVPANRIGHGTFTDAQLKTIQEVITLIVFCVFSVFYLKEELKWNYLVGFALIAAALSSQTLPFTAGRNVWYYFNWDRHRFFTPLFAPLRNHRRKIFSGPLLCPRQKKPSTNSFINTTLPGPITGRCMAGMGIIIFSTPTWLRSASLCIS